MCSKRVADKSDSENSLILQSMRTFAFLGVLAISIYVYTIKAVKQETFLEEIDQEVAEERGEVPPKAAV